MEKKKRNLIIISSSFVGLFAIWGIVVAIIQCFPSAYKDPGVRNNNYTPATLTLAKEIDEETSLDKSNPISLTFDSVGQNTYFTSKVNESANGVILSAYADDEVKETVTLNSENNEINYRFSIDYFNINKVVVSISSESSITFNELKVYHLK